MLLTDRETDKETNKRCVKTNLALALITMSAVCTCDALVPG